MQGNTQPISLRVSVAFALVLSVAMSAPADGPTKGPKITLGKDTTYIAEPLLPDGTPDYLAAANAITSKGVTPANNAAVVLMRALGPGSLRENPTLKEYMEKAGFPVPEETAFAAETFKRLGMKPLPEKGPYFVQFPEYLKSTLSKDEYVALRWDLDTEYARCRRPWRAEEAPHTARWLQANRRPLELLIAASKRPKYYMPLVSTANPPSLNRSGLIATATSTHGLSRALATRAMLALASGKIDQAGEDLMALHRMGRLLRREPMRVTRWRALAFAGLAYRGEQAMATSEKMTAVQARGRLATLQALPEAVSVTDGLGEIDRLFELDAWVCCARTSVRDVFGPMSKFCEMAPERLPDYPLDWDLLLRLANTWHDRSVAVGRFPAFKQRKAASDRLQKQWKDAVAKAGVGGPDAAKRMATWVNATPRPDRSKITRATFYHLNETVPGGFKPGPWLFVFEGVIALRRLAETAMGLAAWRAEKGAYPPSLEALRPRLLKTIPLDVFTDKPLIYRRQDEGYILYSVGPNLTDDGGVKDFKTNKDDIVVRAGEPAEAEGDRGSGTDAKTLTSSFASWPVQGMTSSAWAWGRACRGRREQPSADSRRLTDPTGPTGGPSASAAGGPRPAWRPLPASTPTNRPPAKPPVNTPDSWTASRLDVQAWLTGRFTERVRR